MRALFRFRQLLVLWLLMGTLLAAQASHIRGGDITYAPVASTTAGVPRYHVVVRLFRDPVGVDQKDILLTCSRNGCGAAAASSFVVLVHRSSSKDYLLGCPAGVSLYQVYLFETDVDLPRGQWTLSFTGENRASNIRNLDNAGRKTLYLSAFLDNILVAQNASPQFLSTLLPFLNGSLGQRYSFSTFDADHDSLAYSFTYSQEGIEPLRQCGNPLAGTISPHFQLDAATGALSAPATFAQQGFYIMAVRVSEYRRVWGNWELIGGVTRDVVYLAADDANPAPSFTGLTVNDATTVQPLAQPVRVQPGQTVRLTLNATDPDAGQALRFASEATTIIPGLSLQTVGTRQARLTWQVPATLPPGRYVATVAVLDDGCPRNAAAEQTISFLVTTTLAARPALTAAPAAFPTPFREQVQFQAAAGQVITVVDGLGRVVAHLVSPADGRVVWQPAATLAAGLYVARGADGRPLARLLRAAE